jgi:hypothetical protein
MSATTRERIPAPEPGVYPDVPFDTYTAWDAANHSTLKKGDRSPAHLLAAFTEPPGSSSPAQRRGQALAARLLEPELRQPRVRRWWPINEKTRAADGPTTKAKSACLVYPYKTTSSAWGDHTDQMPQRDDRSTRSSCRAPHGLRDAGALGPAGTRCTWTGTNLQTSSSAKATALGASSSGASPTFLKRPGAASPDAVQRVFNSGLRRPWSDFDGEKAGAVGSTFASSAWTS